jgi:hypothetical protein
MDMERPAFEPGSFDLVVNQESFCSARDKGRYLGRVHDLLRPGGTWSCIDSVPTRRRKPEARLLHGIVYDGFQFPSLPDAAAVERQLLAAGFGEVRQRDLSREVLSGWTISPEEDELALALTQLCGESRHSGSAVRRRLYRGHFAAGTAFIIGLRKGYFRHLLFRARKPT